MRSPILSAPDSLSPRHDDAEPGQAVQPGSRLRSNRDYLYLTAGQTVSTLGAASASFAMPLVVLSQTGSVMAAGLTVSAATLGNLTSSIVAGSWADRHSRRGTMTASLAGRAVLWTIFGASLVGGWFSVWLFAIVAFCAGSLTAFQRAAEVGVLKALVPSESFPTAMAVIEGREAATSLGGAPMGALLLRVGSPWPFLFNALSYVAALLAILRIKAPLGKPDAVSAQTFLRSITEGLKYIWSRAAFRVLLPIGTLLNLASNACIFALVLIFQSQNQPTWAIAVFQSSIGASLLLGALFTSKMIRALRISTLIVWSSVINLASFAVSAVWHESIWVVVPATVAAFVVAPASNAAWMSYVAVTTPDRLIGRVASAEEFISTAAAPVSTIAAAAVVAAAPPTVAMLILVSGLAVAVVFIAVSRSIRALPKLADVNDA